METAFFVTIIGTSLEIKRTDSEKKIIPIKFPNISKHQFSVAVWISSSIKPFCKNLSICLSSMALKNIKIRQKVVAENIDCDIFSITNTKLMTIKHKIHTKTDCLTLLSVKSKGSLLSQGEIKNKRVASSKKVQSTKVR